MRRGVHPEEASDAGRDVLSYPRQERCEQSRETGLHERRAMKALTSALFVLPLEGGGPLLGSSAAEEAATDGAPRSSTGDSSPYAARPGHTHKL